MGSDFPHFMDDKPILITSGDASRRPLALNIGLRYGLGGEGRIIAELAKFLPDAGVDLIGVVSGPNDVSARTDGKFLSFAPEGAGMVTRLHGARVTIARVLHETKPDIVGSHFALYTAPAIDLLRRLPLVTHFHGPWAAESKQEGAGGLAAFTKSRIEQLVYQRSNLIIVLSQAFAELASSRYRIGLERIRIIPGAVDVERFAGQGTRDQARTLLGLPTDRPLLVSVRRLVKRMGLAQLVEATKLIAARIPDVLLCIAGEGPLRSTLEQQVSELDLHRHVRFLGYISEDNLPRLYRAADINVVPTLALEGFGLVAAEAMAAGTPSMVTPIGGLPEVVQRLSPNLVFASSTPHDLAEGLSDALLGRIRLPDSQACREYINANFTSTLMATRTADVYRELL